MKEEYKEFIGIYDESVPVELCNVFVENWEEAKKNQTIMDFSKKEEPIQQTKANEKQHNNLSRKDEFAVVAPLASTIYPKPPVNAYFQFLSKCFQCYIEKYSIEFDGVLFNDIFKIHKVRKSEGFHNWHYESGMPVTIERMMTYMTYLEVPKEGGETEFLHQSLRINPVVGRTLIWPAGFTHQHRGNPPLDGEKMYITGWFNASRVSLNESPGK